MQSVLARVASESRLLQKNTKSIIGTVHCAFAMGQVNSHMQSQLSRLRRNATTISRWTHTLSSYRVSNNIEFLTQDSNVISSKNVVRNVNVANNRPMLIMLSWLMADRRHLMKFVNLYMEQGFDVTLVSIKPWQLLWPQTGSRLIAADLLTFLHRNESYQQILLHGFSVGGYMWGEVLDLIQDDKEKYTSIRDKIVGHVWDSAADINEIPVGIPRALFPNNIVMQILLRKYIESHMKIFQKQSTKYYLRSSQVFHTNSPRVPALMLMSKTDPVGTVHSNQNVRDSWERLGIKVYVKVFEKSPHVGHFYMYPKEYVAELYAFLQKLNLIQNEEKIKARL